MSVTIYRRRCSKVKLTERERHMPIESNPSPFVIIVAIGSTRELVLCLSGRVGCVYSRFSPRTGAGNAATSYLTLIPATEFQLAHGGRSTDSRDMPLVSTHLVPEHVMPTRIEHAT
jgi:hypothetical protein